MNVEIQIDHGVSEVNTECLTILDILNKDPEASTFLWFYIYLHHNIGKK